MAADPIPDPPDDTDPPTEPTEESGPTPVANRAHPLHWFAGRLHGVLDELGEPAVWTLGTTELTETLAELSRAEARLARHRLAVVAHVEAAGLAGEFGATSTAGWVRSVTTSTGTDARGEVRLAIGLTRLSATAQALADGEVRLDQASEVLRAVESLPGLVGAADRARAERHLLAEAAHHDAKALRALGKHLLEVIDPDTAEEQLALKLEAEDAAAAKATHFSGYDDGKGVFHFHGQIPSRHGVMLETLLGSLLNPARPDPIARHTDPADQGVDEPAGGAVRKSTPELKGEALAQLIERYPTDRLPTTGGVSATVIVTIPLETLEGRLQAAGILGTDVEISPGEARRLACAAGVIPAVLDGNSQVLDWGRRRRLHTRAQRLAMALNQQGTCGIEDCDRPTSWGDAHHLTAWTAQGETSVEDCVILCPRHHTLTHQPHLKLARQPHGGFRLQRQ